MSDPTSVLRDLLHKHPSSPFLFVGSGFSRRYLGLEDWAGLLERFCRPIRNFGYYKSRADGALPAAASLMADDYNEWWWKADETADRRAASAQYVKGRSDALKVDIADYMKSFNLEHARSSAFGAELDAFPNMSVDGVITTNWDELLEELFPDFKVFVGQEELLFSNPQSIGEIYKIHGSASSPSSMVLTQEDYSAFSAKNPYLAAKLVTIFVEHPIIFLGYSIADPHIRAIITSIAQCLTQDKVDAFQRNLIFVQRTRESEEPAVERTTIQSGEFGVTMMVAKVADYKQVFEALSGTKRKLPARVLRFFKEQLYEVVHAPATGASKIAVVDYEEIGSAEDVEFVVGVGVAKRRQEAAEKAEERVQTALAKRGYAGIEADELFVDLLQETSKFNAGDLLETAFPIYGRSNRVFTPVYRYLRAAGINSMDQLATSKFEGAKRVVKKMSTAGYALKGSYGSRFKSSFTGLSTQEIIDKASGRKEATLMLPFQSVEDVDRNTLRNFLIKGQNATENDFDRTNYKKLLCFYDRVAFGF